LLAASGGQRTDRPTIPPFEFENWAVIALGGIPKNAQAGDMGVASSLWLETSGHRPDATSAVGATSL